MTQSKVQVYIHCVWATYQRLPMLTPEIERAVYRCIENEAHRLRCRVLAINGMPDHVHLCVKLPSRLDIARLMNQVKGVASHFVHQQLPGNEGFAWQEGYGAFSVGPREVSLAVAYIENQKDHHASNTLDAEWEATEELYLPRA